MVSRYPYDLWSEDFKDWIDKLVVAVNANQGGGGAVAALDDGVQITAEATGFDFAGTGVTVYENSDGTVTVAIPSSDDSQTTIIVTSDEDATNSLQTQFETIGAAGGGKVVVRRTNLTDAIYLSNRLQVEYSNMQIEFASPVILNGSGGVRIKGEPDEYLRVGPNIPTLDAYDAYNNEDGLATFELSPGDGAEFQVDDYVVVRGLIGGDGTSVERMFGYVTSIENDVLVLDRPIALFEDAADAAEFSDLLDTRVVVGDPMQFRPDYIDLATGEPILHPVFGTAVRTRITPIRASRLDYDANRGDISIPVYDGSVFSVGDIVRITDDSTEDDISGELYGGFDSLINSEFRRVVRSDYDEIELEAPLSKNYRTLAGARVEVINAPKGCELKFNKISWDGAQTSRNFHAIQLDYAAHCRVQAAEIDGWNYKIGMAVRISNCYDCHVFETTAYGNGGWGSGEGYQLTAYYSSFCSIRNCMASDGRHSILVQGGDHIDIFDNTVTADRISGIDTHGVGATDIRIGRNKIFGGVERAANQKVGIRIGNSSHVVADRNIEVFDNQIFGYDRAAGDAGIDVVGPSTSIRLRNNHIEDCDVGIGNSGNNSTRVEIQRQVDQVLADGNTFKNVASPVKLTSETDKGFGALVLMNSVFDSCGEAVDVRNIASLRAHGNRVVNADSYADLMFYIENVPDVLLTGNDAHELDTPVELRDCPAPKVIRNLFGDAGSIVSSGTTAGLVDWGNTFAESAGGQSATIEKRVLQDYRDLVLTGAQIVHNDTAPGPTDGAEVQYEQFTAAANQTIKIEAVIPYLSISSNTDIVTMTVFFNGELVALDTDRVTTGGGSGNSLRAVAVVTGDPSGNNSVMVRIGHDQSGIDITLDAKYGGNAAPFILIEKYPA